jgi:uncharacterized protein
MRTQSFTIKATDYCNLACSYCYSPNLARRNLIRTDLLEALADRMASEYDDDQQFLIVWHGSEPMGAGLDFFEVATRLFDERLGGRVTHHMQSNLTLVSERWTEFLAGRRFTVSTSIDGPRAIHDTHRVDRRGHGSFDRVVAGIERLKAAGISVSAIAVVTRANRHLASEIFEIAKDLDLSLRVNPVLVPEGSPECLPSDAYGQFVIALTDLWLADPTARFDLEPVRSMALRLTTGHNLLCEQEALCYSNLTGMGTDGSLYPCNRFVGVPALKLGHISTTPLRGLRLLPLADQAGQRHVRSARCRSCRLLSICQGGCMYHAHVVYGDAFREDYFCESYIELYDYIIDHLGRLLSRLQHVPADPSLARLVDSLRSLEPAAPGGPPS